MDQNRPKGADIDQRGPNSTKIDLMDRNRLK